MASGPITLWQINGETVETVSDFIFLGSKITADGDCSQEIKRCLRLLLLSHFSRVWLCDPIDGSPPGSAVPGILQARVLEWGGIAFSEKTLTTWRESDDQTRQHIKKQRRYCANKDTSSQSYGFFSSHVWMWELDNKGSWAPKNWCFWAVVLEKTLGSSLDCKETKTVNLKGNQS